MPTTDTPWSSGLEMSEKDLLGPDESGSVDVCVVGGGIAGLTTAYLLASAGRSVLLFEAGPLAGGESSRTSAHLVSALDDRFTLLEHLHGRDGARLAAESHMAAIDLIERIIGQRRITCSFRRINGYLMSASGDLGALRRELVAAGNAGLTVEWVEAVPSMEAWSGPALRFARQARFDPAAYLAGLIEACADAGVRFMTHTRVAHVREVETVKGVVGGPVEVETADGVVTRCSSAVVATNVPINDRVVLQTKMEAFRTYVIAARVPTGSCVDALVWDDGDPYHYLRLSSDAYGDLLLVGGEDHKTGQGHTTDEGSDAPRNPHAELEVWMRARFPTAGEIVHAWSGQIIEPVDSLAYIGLNPGNQHIYVIAGDSGNGLTHASLGAQLVSDLIRGLPNAWEELYRPSRISLLSATEYVGHNANVLRQYGDWVTAGDVGSIDEVPVGAGCVVRNGLHPIAAYRDERGGLQICSAICPHLGGMVRWNGLEKTWDCPCHGSRFSSMGAVLNGPANVALAPVDVTSLLPTVAVLA